MALLDQAGVDPLRELVRLAGDAEKRGDLDVARRCWAALVGYRYSKPAGNSPAPEKAPPAAPAPAIEPPSWFQPGRR
jgi:hypothetical protein